MRSQGPQYYYPPPSSGGSNWLERLKQPPWSYVAIGIGVLLAIYALYAWPKYGARILILLIAFPIHELAHALTAYRLGDPTPKYDGRLTLNPLKHLDVFGSILIIMAGLGWAKPVRFNPYGLRMNPRTGAMVVAIAGPLSNLALAVLMGLAWRLMAPAFGFSQFTGNSFVLLFYNFALINVVLFFFNLIPLAPLDGFTVLRGLLPPQMAYQLEKVQQFSFLIFLALFLFGGGILSTLLFSPSISITRWLFGL